jgi:DNA-binding NarL/FixJ family response regulator
MSRIVTEPQRVWRDRTTRSNAALVAGDDGSRGVLDALDELGFAVVTYDDVGQLLDAAAVAELSLVVLRSDDDNASARGAIAAIVRASAGTPIVLVCPRLERWDVRAALSAGASGVVFDTDDRALRACIGAVCAGQTCVPREHSRQIDPPVLSNREKQILGLLVMGYMNSQIAERLFLAESTVKSHLSSAFGKLGVRSRNQAVDLILDPAQGLGMGILGLVGEHVDVGGA